MTSQIFKSNTRLVQTEQCLHGVQILAIKQIKKDGDLYKN